MTVRLFLVDVRRWIGRKLEASRGSPSVDASNGDDSPTFGPPPGL